MRDALKDWQMLAGIIVGVLALTAVIVTCDGPKKQLFADQCKSFCEQFESKALFCSEAKRQVVCE